MAVGKTSRVSATEARVHFGEIMRRAEQGETLVVERSGEPKVILMSLEHYRQLEQCRESDPEAEAPEWQRKLIEVREKVSRELGGKEIDWEQIINDMREERSRHLLETFESGRRTLAAEQSATDHE